LNCLDIAEGVSEFRPSVIHPLDVIVGAIGESGFTHIGVDLCSADHYLRQCGDLVALRKLFAKAQVLCSDVGVLRIGDREATVRLAKTYARIATALGAEICVASMVVDADREAVNTLEMCAEVLSGAGVSIALEFLPYSPLPNLQSARAVCAAVGWERCGLLIDSWAFFHGDNNLSDITSLGAEQIRCIQFCDGVEPGEPDLIFESRHCRAVPGNGVLPLSEFAAGVLGTGFGGLVSIEILSKKFRALHPIEQGRQALECASKYWTIRRKQPEAT
jgi:sugar phosphate isomerase/epimerase